MLERAGLPTASRARARALFGFGLMKPGRRRGRASAAHRPPTPPPTPTPTSQVSPPLLYPNKAPRTFPWQHSRARAPSPPVSITTTRALFPLHRSDALHWHTRARVVRCLARNPQIHRWKAKQTLPSFPVTHLAGRANKEHQRPPAHEPNCDTELAYRLR